MATRDKDRLAALHALWGMSHSEHFMHEFEDQIKPETFGHKAEQLFTKWSLDHWEQYGTIITDGALEAYIDDDDDFEALDLSYKSIDRIIDAMLPIPDKDRPRIYGDIQELCQRQAYKRARDEADKRLESDGIDAAFEELEKARKASASRKSGVVGLSFPENLRTFGNAAPQPDGIATGLPILDECFDGGLQPGEVAIYVGPSGSGKSQWLCFEAAQAMMHGVDCVFYTLELGPDEVNRRIAASATGTQIDDIKKLNESGADPELYALREHVEKQFAQFSTRMRRSGQAYRRVEVRDLSSEPPTMQTILDDIDLLASQGIKPKLVIIDYADMLRPRGNYRSEHESQTEIHRELALVAKNRKLAVWTASQVGREGLSLTGDKSPISLLGKIQGAFAKVFTATFVVWGAQTSATRKHNESIFYMAKARRGRFAGRSFFVQYDYAAARFRSAEERDDTAGGYTQPNTYHRNTPYSNPFEKAERAEEDDNDGDYRKARS